MASYNIIVTVLNFEQGDYTSQLCVTKSVQLQNSAELDQTAHTGAV